MKSFFKNQGPFELGFLLSHLKSINKKNYPDIRIYDVSTLDGSTNNELTFFEDVNYEKYLNSSNASCVLIKNKHISLLKNKNIIPIISDNPLLDFIIITKIFYPDANYDDNQIDVRSDNDDFLNKNIIIDKRAIIKNDIKIGPNTTIKKNVIIGKNVHIGSNCSISNCIIEDNVIINDGTVIGKIGFGFKVINKKLNFIPHIGCVLIKNSVYIGANCTIDRGSFSNTIIGTGSMLDNQVHIAHNCEIGSNCFIAGQVGIAGSSKIGDNCMIGGQAGISGHLQIGSNVYIGGGSGVLQNIKDNKKIMGYPATDMRKFIKGSF
jgi:UDP-3-O-[3-hydroxymyristoyl] glucosamine N-acyltransferase